VQIAASVANMDCCLHSLQ